MATCPCRLFITYTPLLYRYNRFWDIVTIVQIIDVLQNSM